jgi:phosphatidylglycerol lysyltransferase
MPTRIDRSARRSEECHHDADKLADLRHRCLAAAHGQTGIAPFLTAPGARIVDLASGRSAASYMQHRRWAVTAGDVIASPQDADRALSEYLDVLADRGLRPVMVAAAQHERLTRRGFCLTPLADEAVLNLPDFSLAGSRRANIRHSVATAGRGGLTVTAYTPALVEQIAAVSRAWLGTKRGGELGFTLSRHAEVQQQLASGLTDVWVVLDRHGVVQAWASWRHYRASTARVLDIMRRRPDAPNPALDVLIARSLEHYRDNGVLEASLASVPRDHGRAAAVIYPTQSLRAYKQKFDPQWQPRWLAIPHGYRYLSALLAIGAAYSEGSMLRGLRRNT